MPFFKKIHTRPGTIGLWKLEESPEQLLEKCQLTIEERARLDSIKHEARKKEFLATRILLQKLLHKNALIHYDSFGKPLLNEDNMHISISHSQDFACIYLSNCNVGVDIEQSHRNISRVSKRFLNREEQKFIASLDNEQFAMILYWAAKEAIFKCTSEHGILFNEQISIPPFPISKTNDFEGRLLVQKKETRYTMQFFTIENNVLVSCVEK